MFTFKRVAAVSVLGLILCSGLFAQNTNILDTYFDGDELNRRVRNYAINVSNLIPDSTAISNVWSFAPKARGGWFGAGLNGSITLLDRKRVSSLIDDFEGFGGSHQDLSQFPEAIPFLPGAAVDLRVGINRMDIGLNGMWVDTDILMENLGTSFLGENSSFSYRSFGVDLRYAIVTDGGKIFSFSSPLLPALTVQAGYYFTWLGFGIESGNEKVSVDFRNDSYLFALQTTYGFLPIITPYLGMKLIISKTDSGFSWETDRPVRVKGVEYPWGARYNSGGIDGETFSYFQLYGGFGISFLLEHIITLGVVYNVSTNHFGINMAIRYIMM
jgi:hypothetical protein